jgi:hypothetical protein
MSWPAANAALEARLKLLAGINTAQIAWPGRPFMPTPGTTHYRVAFLPSGVDPELHGSDHERGIYQVSVFAPAGKGIAFALTLAQAVADHFKRQVFSGVSCGVPTIAPPITEPDWLHVPVSIPFIVL